jgi:hypothetical protein
MLCAVADDNVYRLALQLMRRIDNMPQQGFAGEGVHHLGVGGFHSRAASGSQYDDVKGHRT